jgi:hypothetical protein
MQWHAAPDLVIWLCECVSALLGWQGSVLPSVGGASQGHWAAGATVLPIAGQQIHPDAQCAAAVEPAEYAEHDNSVRIRSASTW